MGIDNSVVITEGSGLVEMEEGKGDSGDGKNK